MSQSPSDALIDDTALALSSVVANNAMNRGRGLESYRRELGFDPIAMVRDRGWLDLCCGEARALIDAAELVGGAPLIADFDVAAVRGPDGRPLGRGLLAALRDAGFVYDGRRRRVSRRGWATIQFPFGYLGADVAAGPNYTGQAAVHAHYGSRG
ncbi:hypothetical protein [Alloactinosynnema sp. L-07]|uniref:hypothetical protein n=1 Tax=Alloactinosynnema sp. L-07 TaxID=1653480 RepID=UPI00065EF4CC|nr:hypothetical protein [Alloactinosynnema sp. L-07]CRK56250.1 hypothetical protein [Alloactinosynnema sp. L-07]